MMELVLKFSFKFKIKKIQSYYHFKRFCYNSKAKKLKNVQKIEFFLTAFKKNQSWEKIKTKKRKIYWGDWKVMLFLHMLIFVYYLSAHCIL